MTVKKVKRKDATTADLEIEIEILKNHASTASSCYKNLQLSHTLLKGERDRLEESLNQWMKEIDTLKYDLHEMSNNRDEALRALVDAEKDYRLFKDLLAKLVL